MNASPYRLPHVVPVSVALVLMMILSTAGTALAGQPWELWPRGRGGDEVAAVGAPGAPSKEAGAAAAGEAAGKATSAGITAGTVGKAAAIAAGVVAVGVAIGSGGGGGSSTAVQH